MIVNTTTKKAKYNCVPLSKQKVGVHWEMPVTYHVDSTVKCQYWSTFNMTDTQLHRNISADDFRSLEGFA